MRLVLATAEDRALWERANAPQQPKQRSTQLPAKTQLAALINELKALKIPRMDTTTRGADMALDIKASARLTSLDKGAYSQLPAAKRLGYCTHIVEFDGKDQVYVWRPMVDSQGASRNFGTRSLRELLRNNPYLRVDTEFGPTKIAKLEDMAKKVAGQGAQQEHQETDDPADYITMEEVGL